MIPIPLGLVMMVAYWVTGVGPDTDCNDICRVFAKGHDAGAVKMV